MTRTKGALRWGAVFAAFSAGLHVLALPLSDWSAAALPLLLIAVVYAASSFGLLQGSSWVGYIAFVALFVGLIFAIANIWTSGTVPGWLYVAIVGANALSVVALFMALWTSPEETSV